MKEYLDNKLIYEGEYLNGKRNGKGKEYNDNGKLIYEGDYSNGIKVGKSKEKENDKLKYEAEYTNEENTYNCCANF